MQRFSFTDFHLLVSHYFWPLTRTLALFSAAPVFSEKAASKKVKVGLAVLVAFLIGQNLPETDITLWSVAGIWVTAKQILIGTTIGLTIQLLFAAMRFVGEIISLQMGLSFASFFDPSGNQAMPLLARFLNMIFTLLFLTLNGHLYLLNVLADSFTLLPVDGAPVGSGAFCLLVQTASIIFSCGLKIGLPVITLLLALNLTLGLLNRLTPQLSIFVIGFPLSITLGMVALLLMMFDFAPLFDRYMHAIFSPLDSILRALN
ncbi:flagellar biosynthetic protein FliR [Pantoea sp. KPR_PJ]|uniref:flagellar biosynthetic protein FliR n=1 Tax=Pantoea sp. KPR_PJ TaxID=2738375 RepID=UPI003529BC77